MFASRRREPTPHLAWRLRLFIGAAILALVGMFTDQRLPIWGAIGLLAVAFVLRFIGEGEFETDDESDDEDVDDFGAGEVGARDREAGGVSSDAADSDI